MSEFLIVLPVTLSYLFALAFGLLFLRHWLSSRHLEKTSFILGVVFSNGGISVIFLAGTLVGIGLIYSNVAFHSSARELVSTELKNANETIGRVKALARETEKSDQTDFVSDYVRQDLDRIEQLEQEIREVENEISDKGIVWLGGGATEGLKSKRERILEDLSELRTLEVRSSFLKEAASGALELGVIETEGEEPRFFTKDEIDSFVEESREIMDSAPFQTAGYGTYNNGHCTGMPRNCFHSALFVGGGEEGGAKVARIQAKFATDFSSRVPDEHLVQAMIEIRLHGLEDRKVCETINIVSGLLAREAWASGLISARSSNTLTGGTAIALGRSPRR